MKKQSHVVIQAVKRSKWLIVVLGLGLIVAFVYVLQTPEYALYRISRAAARRDLATFYSYVNLPAVIRSIEDAENSRRIRESARSGWEALASTIESNVGQVLKPQQLHLVQREIEARFRDTRLPDPADAILGNLLATRDFFREATVFEIGSVARRGAGALANLEVHVPRLNRTYNLLLVLGKDERWQIMGLEGLATTLDEYARDQQHYLSRYNEQVLEKLAQFLECRASLQYEEKLLGLRQSLILDVTCRNLFPETITAIQGQVTVTAADGGLIKEWPLSMKAISWKSGEPLRMKRTVIPDFWEDTENVFTDPKIRVGFSAQELRFETGQTLRPVTRYEDIQPVN
ncbi:DUF2939 domain-containing protein [Oligoflexus tunisiensis]|uniref:DUF2939 domain-containing protein n=1 Tax=Oligoflexus tunisiensis TaxID=708132 RepID=UPI00114CFBD1|nr:DUF2939 domain-containing protein [Oligoflexus tunisiensis]